MDRLATFLQSYGLHVIGGTVGLALIGLLLRWRPARSISPLPPLQIGAALAKALAGELPAAQELLEAAVRAGGPGRADAMIGLVAVLRARGEMKRAVALVEALAKRQDDPATRALQIRVALDEGRVEDAQQAAVAGRGVPLDLEIAALARADAWDEALSRYQERIPRKHRSADLVGALLAGCAAQYARAGNDRAARRAIKKALSTDPEGLLPVLVGAHLHGRASERDRLAALAMERLPSQAKRLGGARDTAPPRRPPDPVTALLESAQAQLDAGEVQLALGALRDHLDAHPGEWRVRRIYDAWVLEHGAPSDWRMELAEVLEQLPQDDAQPAPRSSICGRCNYLAKMPFFVCPRCDAIGSLDERQETPVTDGAGRQAPEGPAPSSVGAEIADLLRSLGAWDTS